jgi:integrase
LIDFGAEHNPVEVVPTIPGVARDRVLSVEELRAYVKALGDALPDRALRLALYAGGQRMAQLLRATVADWDADSATLRLYDGKGKRRSPREHLLPLAPRAAVMVAELAERAKAAESPYLFVVPGGARMANETPGKRLAEIAATMKCAPFDLRDVRRTVETQLAALGISRDVRAQLLSHGISGVQATHYDRHSYADEKRAALTAWESRLTEITGDKPAGNVVQMKAARKRARKAA